MRIAKIKMKRFFTYEDFEVSFPFEGLTMIVGENGAGKTALGIEVLAWTLWGETVRGSDPAPDGEAEVWFDGSLVVRRARTGRRLSSLTMDVLDDHRPDGEPGNSLRSVSGQTATETQAKISQEFGDWRLFCSTRVFSRSLLSRFGSATNKDRQRLLESILGLEQFSRAEKVAREARAVRERAAQKAAGARAEAEAGLARSRQALEGASGARRPPGPIETEIGALAPRANAARAAMKEAKAKAERVRQRATKTDVEQMRPRSQAAFQAETQAKALRARALRADDLMDCPVCLRAVEAGDRDAVRRHYEEQAVPLEAEGQRLRAEVAILEADLAEQREDAVKANAAERETEAELAGFEAEIHRLKNELAVARDRESRRVQVQAMVDADEIAGVRAVYAETKANVEVMVADAAVAALGPRGARVSLFASALARLQGETNRVLARLGMPIQVRLSGQKEQASGAMVDEVSLKIEGAGAGQYSGASDGEKTRVDIAMILALSSMAQETGVLLFDEIFDPLDDDGIERVAELLEEMGRTRQVIVTTHSHRLAALVPAGNIWKVEKVDGVSRLAAPF